MVRMLITFVVLTLAAGPANSDVLFGRNPVPPYETGDSFDSSAWTYAGDGIDASAYYLTLSAYNEPDQICDATVGNAGIAEGIEFSVFFAYANVSEHSSIAVVDDSGTERVRFYNEGSNYGVFEGTSFGPLVQGDTNIYTVTLLTPTSGNDFRWSLSVIGYEGGSFEMIGAPRLDPDPLSGPITLRISADAGKVVNVSHVRIIGDNIVSTESKSWSSVKALYR